MKDITITSFGLIIAYVLPGVAAIICFCIWSETAYNLITCYFSNDISFSFFLSVMVIATILGLVVNSIRFIIFEILVLWRKRLTPDSFQKICKADKLMMFQIIIDENFRYHQFYGCISILYLIIVSGLVVKNNTSCSINNSLLLVSVFIEFALIYTAIESYKRFFYRRRAILKEVNDA